METHPKMSRLCLNSFSLSMRDGLSKIRHWRYYRRVLYTSFLFNSQSHGSDALSDKNLVSEAFLMERKFILGSSSLFICSRLLPGRTSYHLTNHSDVNYQKQP